MEKNNKDDKLEKKKDTDTEGGPEFNSNVDLNVYTIKK